MKKYIIINTTMAVAIYLGLYSGLDNMVSSLAIGYAYANAWIAIVLGFIVGWFLYDEMVEEIRNSDSWKPPLYFDTLFDIAIIIAFAYVESYVTAVLYTAHLLMWNDMHNTARKLNLK